MAKDLIRRYVWIVDTINRYGKISRSDLNKLWRRSSLSDGRDFPERTFFHYRRAIEENFHIDILCNPRGEYYISEEKSDRRRAFTNWLLDSHALNSAMIENGDATANIVVEDVPSARQWFPMVLEATRTHVKISFTYAGFNRSRLEKNILFHPYMLKLYKQRWYMVGVREKDNAVRTYALDRIKEMNLVNETFDFQSELDPAPLFENVVGMTLSQAPVRDVKIRADYTQAKYLRALPLHPSQSEMIGDGYSIFSYRLKLNYELVHEILGFGSGVKVIEPKELQIMVAEELSKTLAQYNLPVNPQSSR